MQIYVINLKRKPEKKVYMEQQLLKTNKPYVFYEAIDGEIDLEKYNFSVLKEWRDPYSSKAITKGEVGCGLSHYLIWKEIVDKGIEKTIILEDDIKIDDDFDNKLDKYMEQIEGNYELLYLGRKAINEDKETLLSENIVEAKYSYWACGYIVTLDGAKKLIESNYIDNIIPVDEFLPLMFGHSPINKYNDLYKNIGCIKALSVKPYLIYPKEDAFFYSSTYNSSPVKCKPYHFSNKKFMILTVGTDMTNGLERFINYCNIYGFYHKVLGLDQEWKGGDMQKGQGGGQKINLLKEELNKWQKDDLENTLILFTDSYDVICCGSPEEVVNKYEKMDHKIVFAAEKYCWPDKELSKQYPEVSSKYRYLNSGGFIGWANDIVDILTNVEDEEDDQLYYTRLFLNKDKIMLDNYCEIFQTLNGIDKDLDINYKTSRIHNKIFDTYPIILHGNGPPNVKLYLNQLENYTGQGWNKFYHSYLDKSRTKEFMKKKIFVAVFANDYEQILNCLDYPKELLDINVYYIKSNNVIVDSKIKTVSGNTFDELYKKSVLDFYKSNKEYYFHIAEGYIIKDADTLLDCLLTDKDIVAPLVRLKGKAWSNFWGEIDLNGYYKRSFDYFQILNREREGCWNVPYVTGIFLIKKKVFDSIPHIFDGKGTDLDMSFCENVRNAGIFMYLINYKEYGTICKNVEVTLHSYDECVDEWEQKYLHPEYYKNMTDLKKLNIVEVCGDAFNFSLFSEIFCKELIELCNKHGEWSPGKNNHTDLRLGGNKHENVPTQDIHLNQMNLGDVWETIVLKYIAPIAQILYNDYQTKKTNINFVVKYSLEGQCELKSHHDASVYTINVALNNDFKGGGCQFIRQGVDVVNKDIGIATIHPGRLTHYHKGLPITGGERYILVSFIN